MKPEIGCVRRVMYDCRAIVATAETLRLGLRIGILGDLKGGRTFEIAIGTTVGRVNSNEHGLYNYLVCQDHINKE